MKNSFDIKSKIYKSIIDKDFMVIVLKDNYIKSDDAICDLDKKVIIINENREFTVDHYLAIEAHEISHYILNHNEYGVENYEKEADKSAYFILKFLKFYESALLIKNRFEELYNIKICDFRLTCKQKIKIYIFLLKKLFK